ncbi:MAG: GNAT family N-acetyltransferase [bacterium]
MSITRPVLAARPATVDDLEEVADLLHRIFGERQEVARLRWKFGGVSGKLAGSVVLTNRRTIVGFMGQIPVRVKASGHDFLACQGTDVGILEEYRRLDAYMALLHACIGELEAAKVVLSYGMANADAEFTLSTLLGQQTMAAIPLLIRPFSGALRASSGRPSPPFAPLLAACLRGMERGAARKQASVHGALRVSRLDRFDSWLDLFWLRIRDDYPNMVVRDAAYLNWRYVDAPGNRYERIVISNKSSGVIEGFAVLSITRWKDRVRGRICELVTPRRGDHNAAHALISTSLKWLRSQNVDLTDVWMLPRTHLRLALRQHGFIPRQAGRGGIQTSVLAAGSALNLGGWDRPGNWFLSLGDSDTV